MQPTDSQKWLWSCHTDTERNRFVKQVRLCSLDDFDGRDGVYRKLCDLPINVLLKLQLWSKPPYMLIVMISSLAPAKASGRVVKIDRMRPRRRVPSDLLLTDAAKEASLESQQPVDERRTGSARWWLFPVWPGPPPPLLARELTGGWQHHDNGAVSCRHWASHSGVTWKLLSLPLGYIQQLLPFADRSALSLFHYLAGRSLSHSTCRPT